MTMAATNGNGEIQKQSRRQLIEVADDGPFANLLDTGKFEHLWRVAELFSNSSLVPEHFRGHPADCFVAIQMAIRLGVDPFMMLQNTYVVHGKPGMEAKLAISLINTSGLFSTPLKYEVSGGDDPRNPAYKVRAYAMRIGESENTYGEWVGWAMVKAEGWLDKNGSKWKTIPGPMFKYRSATFFGRLHCPERLMGMQTADELHDAGEARRIESHVTNTRIPTADLNAALNREAQQSDPVKQVNPATAVEGADSQTNHQGNDDSQLSEAEKRAIAQKEAFEAAGSDQSPGISIDDLADWPAAQKILRGTAKDAGITGKTDFESMLAKVLNLVPERSTPQQRFDLFNAIVEKRVARDPWRIVPPPAPQA